MSLRELESILRTSAAAAQAGQPLAEALRVLDGPLARTVATDIAQGRSLADALGAHIPSEIRALLAGPKPDLADAALLASDWARERNNRRTRLGQALLHPLLTLGIFAALLLAARHRLHLDLSHLWLLWLAVPLALVPLLGCVPGLNRHLPLLGGWAQAAQASERWQRAALAARWQLADAPTQALLGDAWTQIVPILGRRDAEAHCRRMALLQRNRAHRHLRYVVWASAAGIYLIAGVVLLSAAGGAYQELIQQMLALAGDD